jgi:hypothetical protein
MQRNHSFRLFLSVCGLMVLAACGEAPPSAAYMNRGGPESLLDVSSEVVNLSTASAADLKDLSSWIARDQPTRAELHCAAGEKNCTEANRILSLHGVPVSTGTFGDNSVTLVYERILARDCEQRYIDNPGNYHNTNHINFGCSVASNIVRHVTDKQEFVSPVLLDDPSALRGVNDMRRAYTPRQPVEPYSIDESLTSKAKSD